MTHHLLVPLIFGALLCSPARATEPIPQPSPTIANGAWAEVLRGGHPRLLGPREHLRELTKRKPEIFANVVKKQTGETLLAAGIVHATEGLPAEQIAPWLQRAEKIMARGITNIHQETWQGLDEVARIYDYFHEAIPAADRQKMIEWFNAHLPKFTTNEGAFHNSTTAKIMTYLHIAYATWGENPQAQVFRDHAIHKLYEGKVLPVLVEFGQGGGDTESGWYARGKIWHLAQALELARRIEGYDGFAKAPQFFYQRLAYEMLQGYPGKWTYGTERYPNEGDGSFLYGSHTEYPRQFRTLLGQYFRGSELAAAVENKRRRASNQPTAVADFFWEEAPQKALDLASFPLAHLASGIGHVYARGDWTDDATWLRFTCGDFFAPHQHFDVGNFEIFRREPLATESGEYATYGGPHAMNWLMRSIAHNVVLVHQPDEKWPVMRDGGKTPYANDGGQMWKWEWPADNLESWKKQHRDRFERGDIVAYENRPEFLYVAGDCTKAYTPSKLSSWVRQIVFLRPHTIVILDRLESADPTYQKTWLLHCQNEPMTAGQTSTVVNGKGRLAVQTLLPEAAKIQKIEGYTYDGQTFPPPPDSAESKVAPKWRLEVQPSAPGKEDLFLHVLSTADGKVPAATLVNRKGQVGAVIGNTEVLFDAKLGGSVTRNGDTLPFQQGIKQSPPATQENVIPL